jgi:hypothetical protein
MSMYCLKPPQTQKVDIEYSIELNKTSLKNINKKNILYVLNYFDIKNNDIIKFSNLFIQCINTERYDLIKSFFACSKISSIDEKKKMIDCILKIDKCDPCKISVKDKNKLLKKIFL